jgi:hypothetical protein
MAKDKDKRELAQDIINLVKAKHEDRISTHYDGCWYYHAGCLAFLIDSVLNDDE